MFRFRMEIAGEVQMDRGIARFSDGLTDYRPLWPLFADDFYALERRQFASEGQEGGERWAELSPAYRAAKELRFPGKPILERTSRLKLSLTGGGGADAVRIEERKTLTLGTRVPYAIYHQSPKPRKRLPRRPEIMLTEKFKRTAMHHMHEHLVQMATRMGFRGGRVPGTPYRTDAGSATAWRRALGYSRAALTGGW